MSVVKPGDLVRLRGDHPWAGHVGRFVRYETVGKFGECPRVRLDNGTEVFVMDPCQWGPAR